MEARRWVLVMAGVVVLTALAYRAGKATGPEVIRAERFELVDAKGKVRGSLGFTMGEPGLVLLGGKGARRARVELLSSGRQGLILADQREKARASLMLAPEGSPHLALLDRDGQLSAMLSHLAGARPDLVVFDGKGEIAWRSP